MQKNYCFLLLLEDQQKTDIYTGNTQDKGQYSGQRKGVHNTQNQTDEDLDTVSLEIDDRKKYNGPVHRSGDRWTSYSSERSRFSDILKQRYAEYKKLYRKVAREAEDHILR